MLRAYIQEPGSLRTLPVQIKSKPLWHHIRGLSYTATGYGQRIPTEYMIQVNGKWRRVYCAVYSNNGTLYYGKLSDRCFVRIDKN